MQAMFIFVGTILLGTAIVQPEILIAFLFFWIVLLLLRYLWNFDWLP